MANGTKVRSQQMLCTIHKIQFWSEQHDELQYGMQCPACQEKKIIQLKEEIKQVTHHRDILLQAIEIKQTVKIVPET